MPLERQHEAGMHISLNNVTRRLTSGLSAIVFAALLGVGLLAGGTQACAASPVTDREAAIAPGRPADFGGESPSIEARKIADWIVLTADNQGMAFIIVDKKATKVFVFDGEANLRGATTALLGLAKGDDSAPGVGDLKLSDIPREQRTTPAGRFVASLGRNLANQDILWVDYKAAVALHRVLPDNNRQRRLEQLTATSALDRRITFGCINVPVDFYERVVRPEFIGAAGVVYILPEVKTMEEVFVNLPGPGGAL